MMKKAFLLVCVIIGQLTAIAQPSQGQLMIGGYINYSSNGNQVIDTTGKITGRTENHTMNAGIRTGFMFTENFMAGVFFTSGNSANSQENNHITGSSNNQMTTNSSMAPGIFARYYLKVGTSRFALFGQLGASYLMGGSVTRQTTTLPQGTIISSETKTQTNGFACNLQPGVSFFLNKVVAIETYFGNFGFSSANQKSFSPSGKLINENTNSTFNSGLNFRLADIYLGLNFYLGGRKD